MKKIIQLTLFSIMVASACAQQSITTNPFPKTITVSGSAEMEIIPDEIYVNIELKEYQKRGEEKREIEGIKTQFLESCKSVGIPDSVISIVSFSGFNAYYFQRKKKKEANLNSTITYQLIFKNNSLMDALVDKLDDEATKSFLIVYTSHSKITDFRKQLKIQAVKAAKDKGIYLTEAINEKLGSAITIKEPDEIQPISIRGYNTAGISNLGYSNLSLKQDYNDKIQEVDFKKMKLRYEVTVVFELK